MKIILVLTDTKRKSVVFISNNLDSYSLQEAIQLTQEGKIEGACCVQRKNSVSIRTLPKIEKDDEFDNLSVTIGNILLYTQGTHVSKISPLIDNFIAIYRTYLKQNEQIIKPIGQPEVLLANIKRQLQQHRNIIFDAAKTYEIDPYLIGAILIDEIARLIPFESIIDAVGVLAGRNMSVGIAQVKIDTANSIIKLNLYNPNSHDQKLPYKKLDSDARSHLYTYLINPRHNIFFATAVVKDILNSWNPVAGKKLTQSVIATLYSKGGKPNHSPSSNERGEQIANEFYILAKKLLKQQ
jgi:hypothetical protein